MRKIAIGTGTPPNKSAKPTQTVGQAVAQGGPDMARIKKAMDSIDIFSEEGVIDRPTPKQTQVYDFDFKKDGRYVLLDTLPSHYRFYAFREIWIRPLATPEGKLIFMAKKSQNIVYLISAVQACINVDVNDLIVQDFEYILHWLRLNSYPKKPFKVEWTCYNEVPVPAPELEEGEEPSQEEIDQEEPETVECQYANLTALSRSNVTINDLDSDIEIPVELTLPTVRMFQETWVVNKQLLQLKQELIQGAEIEDEELAELEGQVYVANLAQWLKEGDSLQEKIQLLEQHPDLSLQGTIEDLRDRLDDFGVSEVIAVQCQKCGGTSRRRLDIDYLSFFP